MKILFVDDDVYFMSTYVDALQKRAAVSVRNAAVDALDEIKNNAQNQKYDCVVLDVMMPSPQGWEARTEDGLFTGVEVLKECREQIINASLPILVLTNNELEKVKTKVNALNFPEGLVVVRAKLETPAFLASINVGQLVERWGRE